MGLLNINTNARIDFRELTRYGGEGSGNFGHAGRPGEVGGSSTIGNSLMIDGIKRSTKDSEGNLLGNNEEEIVGFWKWFGDSKVVDEEGCPLVVFRGVVEGKQERKESENPYYIPGMWFTSKSSDENYEPGNAEFIAESFSNIGKIEKAYLKIENPKVYEDYEDLVDEVVGRGGVENFYKSFHKRDGIKLVGSMTDGDVYRDDYVVFNQNQIKSLGIEKYVDTYGGKGSGNFDHAGIPGHQGGSASKISEYATVTEDVNEVELLHYTSEKNATNIEKEGFKVSDNSMYGQGVYFTSKKETLKPNETYIQVKLKPHQQALLRMDVDQPRFVQEQTGLKSLFIGGEDARLKLIEKGWGSVRFEIDPGVWWTLVLDPSLIEIEKK